MSDDFFRTRMGAPVLRRDHAQDRRQLERLNKNLEAFVADRTRSHADSCAARTSAAPVAPNAHTTPGPSGMHECNR